MAATANDNERTFMGTVYPYVTEQTRYRLQPSLRSGTSCVAQIAHFGDATRARSNYHPGNITMLLLYWA